MSLEDNKALVKKFWGAFSESRLDDVLAMLADDATWWIGGELSISGKYTKPEFTLGVLFCVA